MASRSEIVDELIRQGAIAIVRMSDAEKLMKIVEAVLAGGITAIEITLTTPGAIEQIARVSSRFGDAILVGAGSVLDMDGVSAAIDAGAQYIVSPVFNPDILAAVHAHDVPALPGAFTPTEIQTATEAGADIVKVFPADIVGMAFINAIQAPMPHLRLMPTGGVTPANAGDWIRAGACAVGVGSALLNKKAISEDAFEVITDNARTLRRSIDEARA